MISLDMLAGILIAVSPFALFAGEKLFKPFVAVISFIAGAYGTYLILEATGAIDEISDKVALVIVIVIGILVAGLVICLYKWAVFIVGAIAGFVVGGVIFQLVSDWFNFENITAQIIVIASSSLLFGIFSFWVVGVMLKVLTAILGGFMFVSGTDHFLKVSGHEKTSNLAIEDLYSDPQNFECRTSICIGLIGAWIALSVLGMLVQFHLIPDKKNDKENVRMGDYERL